MSYWITAEWDEHMARNDIEDFVLGVEAEKLVAYLRANKPAELRMWLDEHAATFVADCVRHRGRSRRSKAQQRQGAHDFAEAAARFEAGDDEALNPFKLLTHCIEGRWKRLGAMRGQDHLYVADDYRCKGKKQLLLAKFHQAVAERIGDRTTEEVFTEEKYLEMYRSLTN